jgi:DNA primase
VTYSAPLDADGRFTVQLPSDVYLPAAARAALREDDDAARGLVPFVKLDGDGIHIITPLGRLDEHDRTDHVITRRRAREMARALLLLADTEVTIDGGTRTVTELPR